MSDSRVVFLGGLAVLCVDDPSLTNICFQACLLVACFLALNLLKQ